MILFFPFKNTYLCWFLAFVFCGISCAQKGNIKPNTKNVTLQKSVLKTGAENTNIYLPLLKGKNIAVVANQTSILNVLQRKEVASNTMGSQAVEYHLVDYLHKQPHVTIKKVFAPEHGFRGKADAGEVVKNGIDNKTGLPIISLYGKNKKPTTKQLEAIDIILFDIQDVGARFYTYISTLHYVMEACAENNISIIVLDRPNPNAHYIDGPILEEKHKSFVGMHPVPIVYGMTIGEYAKMINGEKWLKNNLICDLKVIPIKNYTHQTAYDLPIKPSPNLPNTTSINLYPSLCFFEGTNVSAGRGTEFQFQIYGSPFLKNMAFTFTPKPNNGSKSPKHEGKLCYGENLQSSKKLNQIHLDWLLKAYTKNTAKIFFNPFFTKLAGTEKLQQQVEKGLSKDEIRKSWEVDLRAFKKLRSKYVIYK